MIQLNPSKKDTIGTYCSKCPYKRGVLISEVVLFINVIIGTPESVLIREVSSFQSVLLKRVPLYTVIMTVNERRCCTYACKRTIYMYMYTLLHIL